MSELTFMISCVEEYKRHKKISGKDTIKLFERYSVCEYIKAFYEVLNKNDFKYIVGDIELYINSKKNPYIY